MKRKNKLIVLLMIVCFMFITLVCGCRENDGPSEKTPVVETPSISFVNKNVEMYVGDINTLEVVVENTDETVVFESSDTSVVSVTSSGEVTALKEGNVVITAKIREVMAVCNIKVETALDFSFTNAEKKVYVGKTTKLNVNYVIKGETVADSNITYESSDEKIVRVDSDGVVTGIKVGEATITAKCGELSTQIKIVVSNLISIVLDVEEVTLNPNVASNSQVIVTASVKKNGINVKNATINWSVLDDDILKLNGNNNVAVVNAIGCGNTALIAEYEGELASCIVTSFKTVSTIADMEAIKLDINGWFKLVNDIDFTGYAWSSITPWMGDPVNPELYFGGIFDGQGYTLSNINCLAGWHQGLFGLINEKAIVKNVSIINLVNQATSNKSAAVVALNYGRVENIYAETVIQSDSQSMWNAQGGLVATNHPGAVVKNCIVKVTAARVYKNTGALCGYNCGILENCYAICTDAVLPSVYTQTSDYGELVNSYTYSDESSLYGDSLFTDYDRTIWNISDYDIPSLYSYPNADFKAVDTYLTIGKEYVINPFNVKGIDAEWNFEGDTEAFDYYILEDGSLNVLPLKLGNMEVSVILSNGKSSKTRIVSKGVVLVPSLEEISLNYLNPGLDSEYKLSFTDEENSYISNNSINFISNNEDVVKVNKDGTVVAVGGGKTTISLEYQGDLYIDLIDVDVVKWIQISTPQQLDDMRNNVFGMYCLVNDIDYGGNTYKTIGRWDGDETNGKHFAGTFDGNGYSISNLVLPSEGDTSGIWGQTLATSVVRNVNFINISCPQNKTDIFGIVGFNEGLIENVYLEMNIKLGGSTSIRSGGGIAGTNEFRGIIRNCISVIKVDGLSSNEYFGSLCGLNQGVLENSFSIVYGNEFNQVNAVSYDNGTVLASYQYASKEYKDALATAISKEAPFGTFDSTVWVIESDKIPILKKLN